MATESGLHVERGGTGSRTLLLLHGMGCSAAVWSGLVPLLGDAWNWVAPDFPGHGRSAAAATYGFDRRAAFARVGIGVPDLVGPVRVLHERGVRIMLASGENDSMAPAEDLAAILPGAAPLPGVGFSVQVGRPELMLGLLEAR